MLTKIIKFGAAAGLLLASMSWKSGTNGQLLLDLLLYAAVIVMVQQAVRAQEYLWAGALVGMALIFNPVVPPFTPAGNLILLIALVGLWPIVITFAALAEAMVTLYPNVITEPYLQSELLIPTSKWIVV